MNKNYSNNIYYNNTLDQDILVCRICFRAESDIKDPLISPCKCTGSMSYIHYTCLQKSIKMKETAKSLGEDTIVGKIITWNNFDCEICLSEYPKYIKHKSIIYPIIENNTGFEEYAQIEMKIYDEEKQKAISKGVIFLKLIEDYEISIVSVVI